MNDDYDDQLENLRYAIDREQQAMAYLSPEECRTNGKLRQIKFYALSPEQQNEWFLCDCDDSYIYTPIGKESYA